MIVTFGNKICPNHLTKQKTPGLETGGYGQHQLAGSAGKGRLRDLEVLR